MKIIDGEKIEWWISIPELDMDMSTTPEADKLRMIDEYLNANLWTDNHQDVNQQIHNLQSIVGFNAKDLHVWEMDRAKDAAFLYINGFWLASIATCACICEFVSYYLFENLINEEKDATKKKDYEKHLKDTEGNLCNRLKRLLSIGELNKDEYDKLDEIRIIRNTYLHIKTLNVTDDGTTIKESAKQALNNIIEILNMRS